MASPPLCVPFNFAAVCLNGSSYSSGKCTFMLVFFDDAVRQSKSAAEKLAPLIHSSLMSPKSIDILMYIGLLRVVF